ncbi:MAG: murein L,D-transpeptidase [bacterium]|nr:murein L,D-transpeptidase [bacterium]
MHPFVVMAEDLPARSDLSLAALGRVETHLKDEMTRKGMEWGQPIYIRIFKLEKVLEFWVEKNGRYELFKTYSICSYGTRGLGPKTKQGDSRAPEGFYFVKASSFNPWSSYHLSFNLGYPNAYDRHHNRTGSALMVHGECCSIGCYAMTNSGIEEIYSLADAAVRNGQKFFRVHIFPFRMNESNMKTHAPMGWNSFWENLKDGYDYFGEHANTPPNVQVEQGLYIFN